MKGHNMIKGIVKLFTLLAKIIIFFIVFLILLGAWATSISLFISLLIPTVPPVIIYIVYRTIKRNNALINTSNKNIAKNALYNNADESETPVVVSSNTEAVYMEEENMPEKESEVSQQTGSDSEKKEVTSSLELPPLSVNTDSLLVDVGCFVAENDKASIGLIQRKFKIGFNRAAYIMDQLGEIGLVSSEIDTKPRVVLMTKEEFLEQLNHIDCIENESSYLTQPITDKVPTNKVPDFSTAKAEVEYIIDSKVDYSKDGEVLPKLQNSIIPCAQYTDKIALINTLIKFNSWDKLKFIMIDRSGIDFLQYHLLPHLFIPIISDDKKVQDVLDWVYAEMQDRIKIFLPLYARDIFSYNIKVDADSRLPVIVIIISEMFGMDVENSSRFTELLLNSTRMGICFIGFSKMECKSLNLGVNRRLFEIKNISQFLNLLTDTNLSDNKYSSFDDMDGIEFERYCANLLRKNDFYDVEVTKDSGDQGIDIIATKDNIQYGIQCKCYSSDIGNKAVQEAFAGKTYYGCHVAVVLTNRYFTKSAKELAATNKVILWDRNKLESLIASAKF